MTVVFSLDDIAAVSVTREEKTASVHFTFNKQVPVWNIRKTLTYISGEGIRVFFEEYVPELKVAYFSRNKYGGVDPW